MLIKLRQPVSGLTHLAGAVSALIGQAVLLTLSGNHFLEKFSLLVYSSSLFLMFLSSSLYHLVRSSPRTNWMLRNLDHAAIYLLIAGTYTPFCMLAFDGFLRWGVLAIIWTLALTGIFLKICMVQAPRWIIAGDYIAMGWLCIFAIRDMLVNLSPNTLFWLFAGGFAYTAGAVIYITRRMDFIPEVFGFHEVWHIFVMLGAAAHFVAVCSLLQTVRGF
ncbi:MAG: hemolysin III family protein [Chloroflexi bacterium]|nr:MAG: hemolysin III family protein [Chloroflexota bacterium]